jgi:hypothetical protein
MAFAHDEAYDARKAQGKGHSEEYFCKGVEICVSWQPFEYIKESLAAWNNEEYLWAYSTGKVVYDASGEIRRLVESIKPYPTEIKIRRLFWHYFFLMTWGPCNLGKTINRKEYESAAVQLYQAVSHLIKICFLLEDKFAPNPKWWFYEMRKLPFSSSLLPNIREVLCIKELQPSELLEKLNILEKLIDIVKAKLREAGVPEEKLGEDWWRYEPVY